MAKTRSNIAKGRLEQKRVLKAFQEAFGLSDDQARCAIGAENGTDIKFTPDIRARIGLSIEVKNVRNLNLWKTFAQAEFNTDPGTNPALVVHRSIPGNKQRLIVVPLEHYLDIRKELEQRRNHTCQCRVA